MIVYSRLLLALALCTPSVAFAQEKPDKKEKTQSGDEILGSLTEVSRSMPLVKFPDPPKLDMDGELQYWLNQGSAAPFDGVQLNVEAASLILSEYRSQKARGEAAIEKQRSADFAVLQLQTGKLQVEVATLKTKSDIQRKADTDAKERLKSINKDLRDDKKSPWGDIFKVGAGVGVGALVGILLGMALGGG